MQVVKKYPNGMFSWVDLATTDADGAKAFYNALFGWEYEDTDTDMGIVYTFVTLDGHKVAALSQLTPDMMEQGIPTVWSSYINHEDVDAVAEKVTAAGGTVMMPPMDVSEDGRIAVFQDPLGAQFGVWQPKAQTGAELVNIPNTLVWNELQVKDGDTAKAFYTSVFGWGLSADEGSGYIMFDIDGRVQAGMVTVDDSYPAPPHWAVYFRVEDVAAATAKVKELGGTVMMENIPAGEMGTFSAVQDPQGGAFVMMQFNGEVDAPPGY